MLQRKRFHASGLFFKSAISGSCLDPEGALEMISESTFSVAAVSAKRAIMIDPNSGLRLLLATNKARISDATFPESEC
jgi:hypothetical protein